MNIKDEPIEFREVFIGNDKCLQVRMVPPPIRKNFFKHLIARWFYSWSYVYVCISDPYKEEVGEEIFAYDLLKCGLHNAPEFSWFIKNIKTFDEFDKYVDEYERKNIER